jgi:two-component system, cell cycle response regulator CpdR
MAKVLIAENELALREFIARGLERRGHSVLVTDDGATAAEALKTQTFDLLLTDIDMPIMDGIALVKLTAPDHPSMKIVVMSGHEHQLERAQDMTSMVARVIAKPFTIAEICDVVDETIQGRAPQKKRAGSKRGKPKS